LAQRVAVVAMGLAVAASSDAAQLAQGQTSQATEVQEPAQSRARAALSPAPKVTITDGALTLTADRQSLSAVLGAISSRTRIAIVVSDSLSDARVSVALRAVPLDEGLRRLLSPYDTFYLMSAEDGRAPASIQTIWVFARGEGRDLEPVPPTLWGDTTDLEARLDDADPGVRSDTIEALVERLGERGFPIVQRGLLDPDEGVRLATLSAAGDAGIEIPATDLHTVVLTDPSQAVRIVVLEELASRRDAEAVARTLRDDADPVIRNRARQILGEQEIGGPKQQPR
jgi:hypothetical protein